METSHQCCNISTVPFHWYLVKLPLICCYQDAVNNGDPLWFNSYFSGVSNNFTINIDVWQDKRQKWLKTKVIRLFLSKYNIYKCNMKDIAVLLRIKGLNALFYVFNLLQMCSVLDFLLLTLADSNYVRFTILSYYCHIDLGTHCRCSLNVAC